MAIVCLSLFFKSNSNLVLARLQRSAHCLGVLVALVISTNCGQSIDAAVVSDSASNYTTSPATDINGTGSITGFSNWTVSAGGTAVSTTESGNNVWALSNLTGSLLTASRTFDSPLGIGETFSVVNFAISVTPLFNATGINLNISGSQAARLEWGGSSFTNDWLFQPGSSGGTNGLNGTAGLTSGLRMDFTRTSISGYRLDFYNNGAIISGATQTGTLAGGSSAIDGFSFGVNENGTTFSAQQISIVPEPSTYAMLVTGGLTAVGAAVRRRRRHSALAL